LLIKRFSRAPAMKKTINHAQVNIDIFWGMGVGGFLSMKELQYPGVHNPEHKT
jgi:hypothetical protein